MPTTTVDLAKQIFKLSDNLTHLSNAVLAASLYWTGEDEKKNPGLKTIRTLAGYYLNN